MEKAAGDCEYTSLADYTLRTAPWKVISYSFASGVLGATGGATVAVMRNIPAIPVAVSAGTRTGVFGFTFFSVREYAVTPILTHFSLHPSPLPPKHDDPPAPFQSPHTANLLDTSLSGLLAGTAFSGILRQTSPTLLHLRAGATLALASTMLQGFVNEVDVGRIKLIAWSEQRHRMRRLEAGFDPDEPPVEPATRPPPSSPAARPPLQPSSLLTTPASTSKINEPSYETFADRSDRVLGEGWRWFKGKLSVLAPVKRIEEGEYEKRLVEMIRHLEEERGEVRREIGELRVRRDALDEKERLHEDAVRVEQEARK
ncbi:voltage gated chloride channel domain-containing protein [Rhodotorula toruloides]|uniref:Voltage gated chloride channel domain-containing protein n=1 Tax=Rhodotorula toruloides TaxID=5286 RepID=A0A511KER8_RHOTO|nr:voltage gated chloride channel domain-containing protein [Rhodotorula toruloides]